MATLTINASASGIGSWEPVLNPANIQTATSTEFSYLNADGTLTVITGTNFTYTNAPFTNSPSGGAITQIAHMNAARTTTYGSVTGFALLNDQANRVRFVADEALLAHETLNFHPLRNDMTTSISRADFLGFAEATGHTVTRIDFTKLGAS